MFERYHEAYPSDDAWSVLVAKAWFYLRELSLARIYFELGGATGPASPFYGWRLCTPVALGELPAAAQLLPRVEEEGGGDAYAAFLDQLVTEGLPEVFAECSCGSVKCNY